MDSKKPPQSHNSQITAASFTRFMWRHHFTLFLVISIGGIALAIYSLFGVINASSNTDNLDASGQIVFDQQTINKIQKLDGTPETNFALPTGQRTDPVMEQ